MTYLLPSQLLSWIMDKIDIMLKNKSFQYSHITSFVNWYYFNNWNHNGRNSHSLLFRETFAKVS